MPWVFGYGSLVWKADFPYSRKEFAKIEGYVRRFWHGSTDHRGVVEKPGRVVTLISLPEWTEKFKAIDPHPPSVVWGALYFIEEDRKAEVFEYLNFREKNGYQLHNIQAALLDGTIVDSLIYIAPYDDEHFQGPAPICDIAATIATSIGPSGLNVEYLLELCAALEAVGKLEDDEHLLELQRLVRQIQTSSSTS